MKLTVVFVVHCIVILVGLGQYADGQLDGDSATGFVDSPKLSRRRRSVLSFPNNSSITVTLDLMWPVTYMTQAPTFFNIHLPFRYWIPTYNQLFNAYGRYSDESYSDEKNKKPNGRYHVEELERANRERRYLYKHIESMFSNFGWDGLACLQRAICEVSGAPIGHNDLFGNIVNLLMTPPQAQTNHLFQNEDDALKAQSFRKEDETCAGCELMDEPYRDEYMTAYHHGKEGSCADKYESACPFSLFSMFDF